MKLFYTNKATAEKIESDGDQTCDEVLELLRTLIVPGSTLIFSLPSGLGLDFHAEENGLLWVEFYANELSGAFVNMQVAEEIVKRSFRGIGDKIKLNYADLISDWEY